MELIIVTAVWSIFTIYLLCYLISVKRSETITLDEAKMLWKIHKKNCRCTGKKWHPLKRRGDKIKGFRCDCGFKYAQKRPIVTFGHQSSDLGQQSWGN